jgi:succinate dehydrogenase / fumarate reductase cytochrome b subunit
MSLTGLFLILFLIVHLIGNFQLLYNDGGESFNLYSAFMTQNPLIKAISYGLYFFIILHSIQGVSVTLRNRKAKGNKYQVPNRKSSTWQSNNMMLLGLLIFAFLCIHMGDFWWKMKMGQYPMVAYEGHEGTVQDMFTRVDLAFDQWWIVLIYVIGMIALFFHLNHGFQSAFQSLGLNHNKYTPFIKFLGKAYSIIVPLGFVIIPIWMYFN